MIGSGTVLQDRFLIEEQIGVGGMGAVYRALDQKFGSTVAIKETLFTDTDLAEAFEREARLLNGLHHPIFPHVSDHFAEGEGHFLVMEFIEGDDLSALLAKGEQFSFDTVMSWTLDLLDGLDYLHSQDPPIIHRDIKPNNLKLTSRGNIVLLDFGMAKETAGNTQGMKSVFGYSRRYSPLEQIEGTGTDVRSDIFSLGATVFHLLTGIPPADSLARASAIVAGRPDPIRLASDIDCNIPELVAAILDSALALNPDRRFASARAMWSALERVLHGPEAAEAVAPIVPVVADIAEESSADNFPALEAFEAEASSGEIPASSIFRSVAEDENDPIAAVIAQRVAQMKAADIEPMILSEPSHAHRIEVQVAAETAADEVVTELGTVDETEQEDPVVPAYAAHGLPQVTRYPYRAVGIGLLVLLLGLFGYAILRPASNLVSEQQTSETQASETTNDPEESDSESDSSVTQNEGTVEETEAEPPAPPAVLNEPETARDRGTAVQRSSGTAIPSRANPAKDTASTDKPISPTRNQPANRASATRANSPVMRATRPRIVGGDRFEQPPVSDIESILTGQPRRQSRWEVITEEDLRRERRIRRMIRRNRQNYPLN